MHVKELSIENFRGIRNLALKLEPGINIIVGPNSTGKSSIAEALYLAATANSLKSALGDNVLHYLIHRRRPLYYDAHEYLIHVGAQTCRLVAKLSEGKITEVRLRREEGKVKVRTKLNSNICEYEVVRREHREEISFRIKKLTRS